MFSVCGRCLVMLNMCCQLSEFVGFPMFNFCSVSLMVKWVKMFSSFYLFIHLFFLFGCVVQVSLCCFHKATVLFKPIFLQKRLKIKGPLWNFLVNKSNTYNYIKCLIPKHIVCILNVEHVECISLPTKHLQNQFLLKI